MNNTRFPWRTGVIGASIAALAGLVFLILPFFQALSHLSYDLPFLFRKNVPVDGVKIVYMDVASEERLGQGRWDKWDRSLHARLLGILRESGAKAVAFDLVFQRGTNEDVNARLVDAAKDFKHVAVAAMRGHILHEGNVIGTTLLQPFPELADVAA